MKLVIFFGLFLISLTASSRCEEDYIPPHTAEELQQVADWSSGGAFSYYAQYAGVKFDGEAFDEACPNRAIFNFGLATGMSCINVDVTRGHASMSYVLRNALAKDEENFPKIFMELARESGADIYLKNIDE